MTTQRRKPVHKVVPVRLRMPRPSSRMPDVDLRYIAEALIDIERALATDSDEALEFALNRTCRVLDRLVAEDQLWSAFKQEHRGLTKNEWRKFFDARKEIEQLWGPLTIELVSALLSPDDTPERAQAFLDRIGPHQHHGGKASPDLLLGEIQPRLTELRDVMYDLRSDLKQRVVNEEARISLRQKIRTVLRTVARILIDVAIAAAFTIRDVAAATPRVVDAMLPIAEYVGTAMPALATIAITSAEVGAAIIVARDAVDLARQLPMAQKPKRVVESPYQLARPPSPAGGSPAALSVTEHQITTSTGPTVPPSVEDELEVLAGPAVEIGAVPSVEDELEVLAEAAVEIGAVPSLEDMPDVLAGPRFLERLEEHMRRFDSGTQQLGEHPRDIDPPSYDVAPPF
jgi:hypothetical protein